MEGWASHIERWYLNRHTQFPVAHGDMSYERKRERVIERELVWIHHHSVKTVGNKGQYHSEVLHRVCSSFGRICPACVWEGARNNRNYN